MSNDAPSPFFQQPIIPILLVALKEPDSRSLDRKTHDEEPHGK